MDDYERNKDKELKYKGERQVRKKEEARKFVDAYKASHPYGDCSQFDPVSLTPGQVRDAKKRNPPQILAMLTTEIIGALAPILSPTCC